MMHGRMPIPEVGRYDVVIRNKPETPAAVWVVGSFMLMIVLAAVLGTCGAVAGVAYAGHAPSPKTEAAMEAADTKSTPAHTPKTSHKKTDGETSYHELR
jgi:hypothetical protein